VKEGIRTLAGREPAALPVGDTLEALEVSAEEGLGEAEVSRRLEEFGRNVLEKGSGEGVLKLLWRQVNDPLIYVLLASAVLALALGDVVDAGVVLTVVVLNALIGFVQEYRAGRAIEALASMVPASATVVRGGHRLSVPAEEVVPGDVVLLEPGDQVPADARLVATRNLQADESALTGESLPAEKGTEPVDEGAPVADRTSLVHGGTLVTHGTATAVVVGTGKETELGRVSSMLEQTTQVETPLTRQIAVVSRWITIAVAVIAVLILAAALLRGYPLVDATLAAIALAVAAIPEGLPAVITITLAIGVRRMARRSAVIRRLPAVETLGSATVVCTDKTGTLTRNEMTVRELWTPNEAAPYEVYGVGYAPEGGFMRDGHELNGTPDDLRELLLAGSLCNDAGLVQDGQGSWRVSGDPTEGALIVAARKAGLGEENLKARPRLDAVPFESERQYMATLHERPQGERVIYLKGAPEVVLERCEGAIGGGPLDREVVLGEVERMSGAGMRVLAVAAKAVPQTKGELAEEDLEGGFGLLGLEGMIDPPRQEAIEAVGACRDAGITVKMITGDHAGTASAIARQVGLVRKEEGDGTLTGGELNALSEKDLREAAARINVFARVAPEHKIRLVRALQANGEVSAMTGDGVNDAPALKQADIGVAMGITGTDVSKESADVVLTDDNFASIAAAVEEGRRIYDNLIKALAFLLPSNLGQALIILVGVAFFPVVDGAPLLPMQPTQVLWINLVVAVTLALPLAFEAKEPDVMRRPPRDPKAPVLDRSLVTRTLLVALLMALGGVGLFLFGYATGIGRGEPTGTALAEAQTMAVTTVILFQVFYLMECRSLRGSVLDIGLFSNKWVYVGIGAILLLQLGFVYLPFMNALFGSAPLGAGAWFLSFLVALIVLPVIGVEKMWRKRVHRRGPGG
jgi:magnesium-transporting ATPase (P-type)